MYRIAGYGNSSSEVKDSRDLSELLKLRSVHPLIWLDIVSPTQADLEELEKTFGFHKLALEDVLHTTQRAKFDIYEGYFFMILKVAAFNHKAETYQLSLFVGKDYLVTIRERSDPDIVSPIFDKIKSLNPNLAKSGPDHICYLLTEIVIDGYLPVLDKIDDEVEDIEARIISRDINDKVDDAVEQIFRLKKDLLFLRKAIFPMMELIGCIQRGEVPQIHKKTLAYFGDVYDHVVEVVDLLETSRELVSGALDMHMSKTQNDINEIAKTVTVFAIILMWPSVIGGIYGMNFEAIPELSWGPQGLHGYIFSLCLMVFLMFVTWLYFKRRRWV